MDYGREEKRLFCPIKGRFDKDKKQHCFRNWLCFQRLYGHWWWFLWGNRGNFNHGRLRCWCDGENPNRHEAEGKRASFKGASRVQGGFNWQYPPSDGSGWKCLRVWAQKISCACHRCQWCWKDDINWQIGWSVKGRGKQCALSSSWYFPCCCNWSAWRVGKTCKCWCYFP